MRKKEKTEMNEMNMTKWQKNGRRMAESVFGRAECSGTGRSCGGCVEHSVARSEVRGSFVY